MDFTLVARMLFLFKWPCLTIDESETKHVAFSEAESEGVLLRGVALRLVHFAVSSC